MSQQPTQSSRVSNLSQSRKIIKAQRSVTYKTINPTDKLSQSLEPETYVSPKSQPSVPQIKISSQITLTPGSSKMADSQIKDQLQQFNSNTSLQNRHQDNQQNLRNQNMQSFVSNQDINNNTKKRSEMHILTPKDYSQNQSFVSSFVFQINSTIPISQQGHQNSKQNTQPVQPKNVQSVTTYQRTPIQNYKQVGIDQQGQQYQQQGIQIDGVQVKRITTDGSFQNNNSNYYSPIESRQNCRSSLSLQPSQPIFVAQQIQAPQNKPQKFSIPIEKAYYQNQAPTPLQSDRSIPASKPGINENRLRSQHSLQTGGLPDSKQEQLVEVNKKQNIQTSIYVQEKGNIRGESAPPNAFSYSGNTSLASSFQPPHQLSQNNYLLQSNNLNTSVFNVVVNDQDGLEDQIKRGRIESQQQNSVSKNFSPDSKKGIQNSAFIDYSYKKSITDKVLAIQVQQTKLQFDEIPLQEIIGRPPPYQQKQQALQILGQPIEQKDIYHASSPQFGSISIPPNNQNIEISQAPYEIDQILMNDYDSQAQKSDQNNLSFQKENNGIAQISERLKQEQNALSEVKLESIVQAQNIPISDNSYTNKKGSNRSSTVDQFNQNKDGQLTPSQAKLLEELKQEQKVRESVFKDQSQIDLSSKILVVDYSNTKETSASGRSVSSDPYKGLNSFSQKYEGIVGQLPQYASYLDSKNIGSDLVKNYLNYGVPSQIASNIKQNQDIENSIKEVKKKDKEQEEEAVNKTSKTQEEKAEQITQHKNNVDNLLPTIVNNDQNYLLNNNIQVYATQISSLNNNILNTAQISNNDVNPTNNTVPNNNTLISRNDVFSNNDNNSSLLSNGNVVSNTENNINFISNYISNLSSQGTRNSNLAQQGALTVNNNINSNLNSQYYGNYQVENNAQASQPIIDVSKMTNEEYIRYKQAQMQNEQRSKSEQPIKQLQEEFKNSPQITTTVTTFTTYSAQPQHLLSQVNTRSSQNINSNIPQYESYKLTTRASQNISTGQLIETFKPSTLETTTNLSQLHKNETLTTQNNNSIQQNYVSSQDTSNFQSIQQLQAPQIQTNNQVYLSEPKTEQAQIFERQNLHKEKLRSRQNSDEDVKKVSQKNEEAQKSQSLSNYGQLNYNNNSFGIQKIQNEENQKQIKEIVEEKRKLREVKSVDHLMIQRRFVDPQLEQEVKGWVNPIFEEFIRNNFRGGDLNESDIQEIIKRSKSEIGLGANNHMSSFYVEQQLKQLIEQQKQLIDQQNIQITLQNEVQKSQLYANSHISSPHIYGNKYNENILLLNQLNNSNTKSNSQLLGTLSSDHHLHHQSNQNLQNIVSLNQYQTNYQNHRNISPLSQNSSSFHPFTSQPQKLANGQDLKFYLSSSVAGSATTDNHHRMVSYFDQIVEQQNINPIDYNLTQSGLHDDANKSQLKNQQNTFISNQSVSPVNALTKEISPSQRKFLQSSSPFTPSQQQQNPLGSINSMLNENSNKLFAATQDDRQNLQLNDINHTDEELLLEDLTPFNNQRQQIERQQQEVKQQYSNNQNDHENEEYQKMQISSNQKINADLNSSQDAGAQRINTDRQSSRLQHSQSMKTDQGCEEEEEDDDEYDNVPKYFSENNSVRDNIESTYSVNQNKQSKFQQNRKDGSFSSSSPDLSDREDIMQMDEIQHKEKQVKKSANKISKKLMNISNEGKITEESYSNKNDGSQLTSLNINLYKLQNQQDNFEVGELTPRNNQESESRNSLQEQQHTPKSTEQNQEDKYQTPNEKLQDQQNHENTSQDQIENQEEGNIKISEIEVDQGSQGEEEEQEHTQENQKLKSSFQESIPLEKVEEVDQEYHKEPVNTVSDKKSAKKNKSEIQLKQSQIHKKPNIPRSSSSLAIQKSGSNLSLSKILRKSELSSESNLSASEFIKKSKQSLEMKRKESKESQDSGTFNVFQDIQKHVQDKIQHYNQKKVQQDNLQHDVIIEDLQSSRSNHSAQKETIKKQEQQRNQNEHLQKSPQNILNILSNKQSSLKKRSEKQSPNQARTPQKISQNSGIKIDFQKIKSNSKEDQKISNKKESEQKNSPQGQKGEVLKVQLKSNKDLGIGSKSPKDTIKQQQAKKQFKLEKTSVFNISQSTVRSPNQSQVQSPQSESLKATVKKLQEGSEEFSLNKPTKQSTKKEKQQDHKVFFLHKNQTFEYQPNTQKPISRHNTDQPIESKSSQFKKLSDSNRKHSPPLKITLSSQSTSDRNKISITPLTAPANNNQTKEKNAQKQQKQALQVTITGKNISKEQQNPQSNASQKLASSSSLNDNDQNTLNLYQRYQEKKIQDKELSTSQVFQRKKSVNSNQNISQNQLEQDYQSVQSQKSPENIYQQNQNLRYQQQQYLNNQTKLTEQEQSAKLHKSSSEYSQKQQSIQPQSSLQIQNQSQLQAYKQKQKEQLEKIESKLQQEEQEYQILVNSQTQPTIDATIMKSGKHLSPSQSDNSGIQTVNRLFTSNPTINTNKNLATNISQQQMHSQSSYSNNINSNDANYTQDYEDYLYQEYIKDQRELMIQKNISEGINSGQLTEEQQRYLQECDQENRVKFQEFMKRNVEWVQEKERKIRQWQEQKANLEMQECTFKPLINSHSQLDISKPVYVPSTKSSRLLEEQSKQKLSSQQNSLNHIPSQKSIKKSQQASRVGSNSQIQDANVSRKISNHSNRMIVGIQQQNSPPSFNQFDKSTLVNQGNVDLKQDIEDVLGILKSLSKAK